MQLCQSGGVHIRSGSVLVVHKRWKCALELTAGRGSVHKSRSVQRCMNPNPRHSQCTLHANEHTALLIAQCTCSVCVRTDNTLDNAKIGVFATTQHQYINAAYARREFGQMRGSTLRPFQRVLEGFEAGRRSPRQTCLRLSFGKIY